MAASLESSNSGARRAVLGDPVRLGLLAAALAPLTLIACSSGGGTVMQPEPQGGGQGGAPSSAGRSGSGSGGMGGAGAAGMAGGAGGAAGSAMGGGDAGVPGDGSPGQADAEAPCTPAEALVCNPLAALPESLKETGIFPMLPDLDVLAPNVHPFEPSLQLWSDGLHKKRQVILPEGKKIGIANREVWDFPVGVLLVKTFLSDGPQGPKPVETRIIRRTDNPDIFEQFTFDVYKWNDAGTDATLLNIDERTPTPVTIGGQNITHQIPSRDDCKRCHATNKVSIIGFDEVRLNAPLAPGQETQLETFAKAGFFDAELPSPAAEITDPDPLTQQVKRYVYGNCYHCHNGSDSQAFEMHPNSFLDRVINQMTEGSGTAPGIRVIPGNPEMSVLYRQMTRMNLAMGENAMPPIGVQVADPAAVPLVRQWIMSLD